MNIIDIAIAKQLAGGGGGSGTDSYNDLSNLPKINDVTLSGNKSSSALGLQSEITSDSKLASDLVDDTNQDNKFVTSAEKTTWNGKQNAIDADHKINADYVDDSTSTNKFVTASDKETWNAKQNAIDNSHKLSSDLVDDANHTNKFVTSTEKQTWNAKQNAIDADHKLSSSLVSFSEAEAAAIASGIDSSKVGQISTNQKNIWYALNDGVKNLFPINSGSVSGDGYLNKNNEHGEVLVYPIPAGSYKLKWTVSSTATNCGFQIILADGDVSVAANRISTTTRTVTNTTTTFTDDITIPSGKTATHLVFYINNTGSVSNVMLCRADLYSQDSTYVPFALPNYDLTRLEAEDRASLAEVVDSGAKQLVQIHSATNGNSSATPKSDGYSVTLSGAASANTSLDFGTLKPNKTGTHVFKVALSGTVDNVLLWDQTANKQVYSANASTEVEVTLDATHNYTVGHYTNSAKTLNGEVSVLICTKAAFGVSQKFVPYRLPYSTLGKLKWKSYEIDLSSVTFTKSYGGLYYYDFSVSSDFSLILSVSINSFSNVENKGFTAIMNQESSKIGLTVYDATNPATLSFSVGKIWILVLGFA